MPTLAGDLADILLARVRDPDGTAHDRPMVLRLLAECQRLVNAETRAVLREAPVTVDASNTILDIQHLLPWAIRIETIRDGVRDLHRCQSWREFPQADRLWLKRTGGRIKQWCHFTPARILLYPAPVDPTTLELVYTLRTNDFTHDTDAVQLPPNLEPAILELAEQILLMRQRLFLSIPPVAERFPQAMADTSR
jgi:hypothetical protein